MMFNTDIRIQKTNPELPIVLRKQDIIRAICQNRVVIISGETGSGKTTQIPKFCLEAGRGKFGRIGCTQPRRIAAITVSHRIAEEMGEDIGKTVGYKIRFTDKTSHNAKIKIMTDGILLAEAQHDRYLKEYDTIIVDEAHERSLNIDFVLGILKTLLRKRKNLKLIITSATIDTEKFSKAFDNAPIIEVSGRMYPVEVRYMPPESSDDEEETHIESAVKAVCRLYQESSAGDILIFMPTEQDIRETHELLEGRKFNNTDIFPLYARLSAGEQSSVFAPVNGRKIIIATNIAETSITIPGIKYVIDAGLARISKYSPRSGTTALPILPISKSSADQRKGRCGRVQNGICIRLYSEEDYNSRPQFTLPEILRSNLAEVILRMMALRLGDIAQFPFVDRPAPNSIKDGFDVLTELGAIEEDSVKDSAKFVLTDKGRLMAQMPLDPRLSRMLIEAKNQGCVKEIAIIASALSIQDPRERPSDKQAQADQKHTLFHDKSSDFLTLLNIWNRCQENLNTGKLRKFCKEHFLSFRRMREWRDIHAQIYEISDEEKILNTQSSALSPSPSAIHKAILSGFLSNIALKKEKNIFRATKGREAMIFPGSVLFKNPGLWIMSAEMVETSRLFARTAANIEPAWIEELGKAQCKYSYLDPHWERNRQEVIALEQVSLYALIVISGRPVPYGPISPDESCDIFIQNALVLGDLKKPFAFMKHNKDLIESVRTMEDKIRRRDILVSDEDLFGFYREKLDKIYDIKGLERRIKQNGSDEFLRMSYQDIMRYNPDNNELSLFPDKISLGHKALSCDYNFEPGNLKDGVTVKIPLSLAHSISPESTDWLVPGLLKEKITALLKSLPKEYRKQIVPASQTAEIIANEMPRSNTALATALSNFIYQRFNVDIPASVWSTDALPDHLKMRIAITDAKGQEIRSGRDKSVLLQGNIGKSDSEELEQAKKIWEKQGIKSWDFKDLPESMTIKGINGNKWTLCPALCADNADIIVANNHSPLRSGICLRLFDNHHAALNAHVRGVSALYRLHFCDELKFLKKMLTLSGQNRDYAACMGGAKAVEKNLYESVVADLFAKNIRTQAKFEEYKVSVKPMILQKGKERLNSISAVMKACYDFEKLICALEDKRVNRGVSDFLNELRHELSLLVSEDFLLRYTPENSSDMERYIKTLGIRAQRGLTDFEKDRSKAAQIKPYVEHLNRLKKLPQPSSEKQIAIDELFKMIEEYKVSLFAQELKTSVPVSEKRLNQKIKEIERMV